MIPYGTEAASQPVPWVNMLPASISETPVAGQPETSAPVLSMRTATIEGPRDQAR
jgi:hypothetical protein